MKKSTSQPRLMIQPCAVGALLMSRVGLPQTGENREEGQTRRVRLGMALDDLERTIEPGQLAGIRDTSNKRHQREAKQSS